MLLAVVSKWNLETRLCVLDSGLVLESAAFLESLFAVLESGVLESH